MGGTYTLLLGLDAPATVRVGALGDRRFDAGCYAYTGSAQGPGGFARVDRHRDVAVGRRDVRHWHVDSLLGHDRVTLATALTSAGLDAECAVARWVGAALAVTDACADFGASDCDCESHLAFASERSAAERAVRTAHSAARDGE